MASALVIAVRDHLPFKQGSRLTSNKLFVNNINSSQRPSSIQIRIKALPTQIHIPTRVGCQRPSSTKTRIKTVGYMNDPDTGFHVRDPLPFKQGLSNFLLFFSNISICRRLYSIQTRIKTGRTGVTC